MDACFPVRSAKDRIYVEYQQIYFKISLELYHIHLLNFLLRVHFSIA